MHYLKIPRSIRVRNPATGDILLDPVYEDLDDGTRAVKVDGGRQVFKPIPSVSLWDFLVRYITSDVKMGKGEKAARAKRRLKKAIKDKPEGHIAAIDTPDRDLVLKILDEPSVDWLGGIPEQCTVFMDAFREAKESAEEAEKITYEYDDLDD